MKKYCFLLVFMVMGYIAGILAVTIGSDTTPTRFNTQQVLGNGDRVAGFAWLAAGFSLLNSTVTATFDSFFQVVGNIDLNNGTLVLNQDLIVGDQSTVRSLGNIDGQGHIIEFGPSVSQLATSTASNVVRFTNLGIFIDGDVSLGNSVIEFSGNSMLAGRGNCLTFAPSSAITVKSNSSLW